MTEPETEPDDQDDVAQVETAPSASLRKVFREFWPDTRGIRGRMVLSLLLVPVAPALTTVSVYLFKVLVDDVLTPHDYRLFPQIAVAYLVIAVVGGLVSFVDEYLTAWVGETFVTGLRMRVFAHLQRLSAGWFERRQLGDILSRLTGDIGAIEQLVLTGVNMTLTYAFQLVFFAGTMFFLNWQLTLVSFIAAPAFLMLSKAFSRRIQAASRERRRRSGSITAVAEENLGNLALVQAYDRADEEIERFGVENRGSFRAQMLAIRLEALFGPFSSLVEAIGVLVVIGVAVYELAQNQITLGGLLAFLTYLSQLYGPVQGFAGLSNTIFAASAGAERILELTDQEPAVVDPENPEPFGRAKGALRFEGVGFTYPGVEQPSLRRVELRIEPGQKVAIVGASGAGKSTLTKMLLRTYDPDEGRVTLDGVDLRDISLSVLRGNMAVVLQETLVFDGTVAENIRWGRPDATDEEVEAAARAADAHGFITELDQAYGTRVGQRGRMLSGGQRQRLAIARAMIRDAPVLLLDEPTTGLDAESGRRVLAPLRRLMSGRTTIIISHDLLTVADADRIVVLDGGTVTAVGTHEQLLASSPTYMRLWALHHPGAPRAADPPTSQLPRVPARPRPVPIDPRMRPQPAPRGMRKRPPAIANPVASATERLPAVGNRGRHSLPPSPRPRRPADPIDPPTALGLVVADIVRGALGGAPRPAPAGPPDRAPRPTPNGRPARTDDRRVTVDPGSEPRSGPRHGAGPPAPAGRDLPRPYPLPRPAPPSDAPSGRHAAPARRPEPADARG